MAETRTIKQIHANDLDLSLFRLSNALSQFSETYKERGVDNAAAVIHGLRREVRKHMCKKDLEATV